MPHKNKRARKPRWKMNRGRNVNHQSLKRDRSESRVKKINVVKKLERKGYFDEEPFE
jgi:hypothetical protein